MGGLHQLLCLQKVIYKCYAYLGLETWFTSAGTTKSASAAEKTAHGLYCNTTARVYKEIFKQL